MNKYFVVWVAILAILAMTVACTPEPAPASKPPASTATPVGASNLPSPTPTDAAWQKVVDAARQEGRLTIYSSSLLGDTALATGKGFENRYGIKVDIISGRGAEFIERIRTEQRLRNMTVDVQEATTDHNVNLKNMGVTVSSKDIPALRDKDIWRVEPMVVDPEGHQLVHRAAYLGPWVNTNQVKPGQEPNSYKDLLKPEWKGKILVSDPSISVGAYSLLVPIMERGLLDMDFVRALGKQDLKFASGSKEVAAALAKGEFPFGLTSTDTYASSFVAEGAPIKAISLDEGTVVSLGSTVIIKDSPHPNAAKVFLNWLLGQEGQAIYGKALTLASVRKDVADFRPAAAAIVPKRLIPTTMEDGDKVAKAFRDKLFIDLWKK